MNEIWFILHKNTNVKILKILGLWIVIASQSSKKHSQVRTTRVIKIIGQKIDEWSGEQNQAAITQGHATEVQLFGQKYTTLPLKASNPFHKFITFSKDQNKSGKLNTFSNIKFMNKICLMLV